MAEAHPGSSSPVHSPVRALCRSSCKPHSVSLSYTFPVPRDSDRHTCGSSPTAIQHRVPPSLFLESAWPYGMFLLYSERCHLNLRNTFSSAKERMNIQ